MKKILTTSLSLCVISLFSISLCSVQVSYSQNDSLVLSGKMKQKKGNNNEAIADFTNVMKRNEADVLLYVKKFDDYTKLSDFERAERELKAPLIDSSYAIPFYLRGISYSRTGKNNEAIDDLNTAIKINSKLGAAYYERGRIKHELGKKDEGCIDLGTASSLGDSSAKELFDEKFCWNEAVAANKEAVSKLKLNLFQSALDEIQKSLKLCPDSANYLVIRGKCFLGLGKKDLAMADFDKSISISKNNYQAYFGRGEAYYNLGKFQEAFDDMSKSILLNENFPDAYLYRAYSCEGLAKNESALYDYKQVMRLKPRDPLAFFKSGLLKNEMNDKKGACADFSKAASLGNTEAADYVAQCK